uniref:Uncharacterized protein n=1 Tax=Nelumbo nucifera TaxID=4432 RepID=A0A822XXQ6_NELNU|nr:TPA_asm: hypothetical protein HUJ06_025967 [Nelumbo nucifera]
MIGETPNGLNRFVVIRISATTRIAEYKIKNVTITITEDDGNLGKRVVGIDLECIGVCRYGQNLKLPPSSLSLSLSLPSFLFRYFSGEIPLELQNLRLNRFKFSNSPVIRTQRRLKLKPSWLQRWIRTQRPPSSSPLPGSSSFSFFLHHCHC